MQSGDLLMACSDGLWHYFSQEELASVLYAQPPRDAVEILVGEARRRARGTGDNISIAVLKLGALPAAA
jgi:serine/threonine protein phosphatase PrpC